jgi:hypothetical protein
MDSASAERERERRERVVVESYLCSATGPRFFSSECAFLRC